MELRELRSFCVAAQLRSMSKAAERLDLGQPTVTSHVRRLEAELGMTLFDRLKRPIMLTLAGEKLAEMAMPLVEGIDSLATLTSTAEAAGPVSIASTPDIIPHTLLRVVRAYLDLIPTPTCACVRAPGPPCSRWCETARWTWESCSTPRGATTLRSRGFSSTRTC